MRYCCCTLVLLLHAVYGFCATALPYCLLHTVYGLFMQTNAANDQLGSTGTATARAEISMLLQALQRGRTSRYNDMACLLAGRPSVLLTASTRSSCQHAIGSQPSAEVPSRRNDRRRTADETRCLASDFGYFWLCLHRRLRLVQHQ